MVALRSRIKSSLKAGFTLVELSIVLVIIGLIIGGVLVGRDLIDAAAVRAQISQIEKYQTAVNTFRVKYGYLPGDIPNPVAPQYGFVTRGSFAGQGDGNGILEGKTQNIAGGNYGNIIFSGEIETFWVDLSQAKLIDGGFSQNLILQPPAFDITATLVGQYMPVAKIGQGNYIYVWSGGYKWMVDEVSGDGINYFGLAAVVGSHLGWNGAMGANVSLTVQQAYNIDKKTDDGLPQSGRVIALVPASQNNVWATGGGNDPNSGLSGVAGDFDQDTYGPITAQTANPSYADQQWGTSFTDSCYNNGDTLQPEHYSMEYNDGTGPNCALAFRFQ